MPESHSHEIYGLMGMIDLLSGPYLITITGRKDIGWLMGHPVYRVASAKLMAVSPSKYRLSEIQRRDEETYVELLNKVLAEDGLYYSNEYDLTNSLPNQHVGEKASLADVRHWNLALTANKSLIETFIGAGKASMDISPFIKPCIQGFVKIHEISVNYKNVTLALISRRSPARVGTRFNSRGIDKDGNVSNFVETEQILACDGKAASFVQVRGSVPLFWTQIPNVKYKPPIEVEGSAESMAACKLHMDKLQSHYGAVVAVDLADEHGSEGRLRTTFARFVRELSTPNVKYVHFDFHHICGHSNWHRISLLVERLEPDLDQHEYYLAEAGAPLRQQRGVVRTNCIDCLDRTNVVQSELAIRALNLQLQDMHIFGSTETVRQKPELLYAFKNSTALSPEQITTRFHCQYSGTNALKTDYTRTGTRSLIGKLQDGRNSMVRYVLNNYYDGSRQDALDLFFGRYSVSIEKPSPFSTLASPLAPLIVRLWLFVLAFLLFTPLMMLGVFKMPLGMSATKAVLFLASVFIATSAFIVLNGSLFVDRPRLVPLAPSKLGHSADYHEPFLPGKAHGRRTRQATAADKPHAI